MLGPQKVRDLDRPILTSLEALVPQGNFYRHLDATLDLGFVREWVEDRYAGKGRPSIDPVVFFRLQLIMFFEGIRSERQLIETASLNLAHRWYLGYHLDEELPDHSSLTRIRQRYGLDLFRRFFEHVVDRCQDAGLVWGKELFFDATKVRANAALDSLRPRLAVVAEEHVAALFAGEGAADDGEAASAAGPPAPTALPTAATTPAGWQLLDECRLDPARPVTTTYHRQSDRTVSRTDPDATPMRTGEGATAVGYHDHVVVDGGRGRIILSALVTPADVMENTPMVPLLRRLRFRRRLRPERAIADRVPSGRYGTAENLQALEDAGVRAYVPVASWDGRSPYDGPSRFTYDAERDEYRCPQGQPLRRRKAKARDAAVVYQAAAAACNRCPLKARCTPSGSGRQVQRSVYAEAVERARAVARTPAYERAMRKRKVWVEPLFGEAKQWHGLRRFRLRGLVNVNIEGLLIAAGQNPGRWLAATGWGRHSAPCGSLAAPARPASALLPAF